jgi:hypothetical protein
MPSPIADLSDAEIRDVIALLQERKPLPDKYRFLLFDDKRQVELVWNGKTSHVTNTVLPFQTIEVIDEPRVEAPGSADGSSAQADLGLELDARGRQLGGWTNKLIWGDNKLILSSLKNGPLRQTIEEAGGLKLIYIDPPSTSGPTSRWTSRSAAKPSTRNPTSSNKSPTATPGAKAPTPSSP